MMPDPVAKFITRWADAGSAERANYGLFLSELCDVLGVPRPEPATDDTANNAYVFERAVTFQHRDGKTSTGRIDLYKRGCFVLEAKQYATANPAAVELALALGDDTVKSPKIARGTAAWDRAMLEALGQADNYARHLPSDEDPPPFLLVVDVGHVIELYSDFTQKGKNYVAFPDARSHRIRLAGLANPENRERLRLVWTDPLALDPAKKAAAVTREVAGYLAELAKSFEKNHDPKLVAEFLSRCLFCMFAEDVGLLPKESFHQLLESVKADPGAFVPLMEMLFEDMNQGRFSGLLRKKLLYFNGGLFASARALPVNTAQLTLLRKASALEWRTVEPAIFGTLLERALSPDERHKLGAHYTPRSYVERLVLPAVIEPLREEWSAVRIAAVTLASRGNTADLKKAKDEVRAFHGRLCAVRVLDPACGSGNFLYVALEQMKRLEGEVISLLHDFGDETDLLAIQGVSVDPHQFLGIEINPRAAAIAELVLWIGYLQWHFRVHGDSMPAEPVLKKFANIECRDAVLAYDKKEYAKDAAGKIRYVWNRKTTKTDPVTGREVPDDKAVIPLDTFANPRPATWPQADFIVGNPPFLGDKVMRQSLGEGYVEVLRATYPEVPESADFVMFWWYKAALLTLSTGTRRFGFITTNSIRGSFNRRVIQSAVGRGLHLAFAIPDHPWVDTAEGAAVRIAMTVGVSSNTKSEPRLQRVTQEQPAQNGENEVQLDLTVGLISPDLTTGANTTITTALMANEAISVNGMMLAGRGFIVTRDQAKTFGLEKSPEMKRHVRPIRNGRDLTEVPRDLLVIDLLGLSSEEARKEFPSLYDHLLATVKPERDANARPKLKRDWWLFGEPRKSLRAALNGLGRFIATVETSKHRIFQFLDANIIPEHKLVAIALDNSFHLGILSSRIHTCYALAAGSWLGVGNDPVYAKSRCFDPFPFPDCTEKQKAKIRGFAEELDAHRKRAQQKHSLGLTDIYNVLEQVRAGEALTPKDKVVHDAARVSTLKQLHDDIDAAVADAYGWPWPLTDAEILERVVALNTARAAEEAKGNIRWLRPDYQKPLFAGTKQASLDLGDSDGDQTPKGTKKPKPANAKPKSSAKFAWPKTLPERAKAVEAALTSAEQPLTSIDLAKQFLRAKPENVQEILETLVALGRARHGDTKGTFVR